jgi:hypothetical protein
VASSDIDRGRRFARRRTDGPTGEEDSLAELHAELVLLREENARLKAAEHAGPDIDGLLGRARSLSEAAIEADNVADETTRVLVEGLAIRESLLEICRQIERAMSLFEARLRALPGTEPEPLVRRPPVSVVGGHWSEPPIPLSVDESDRDGRSAA